MDFTQTNTVGFICINKTGSDRKSNMEEISNWSSIHLAEVVQAELSFDHITDSVVVDFVLFVRAYLCR